MIFQNEIIFCCGWAYSRHSVDKDGLALHLDSLAAATLVPCLMTNLVYSYRYRLDFDLCMSIGSN